MALIEITSRRNRIFEGTLLKLGKVIAERYAGVNFIFRLGEFTRRIQRRDAAWDEERSRIPAEYAPRSGNLAMSFEEMFSDDARRFHNPLFFRANH